MSMQIETRLQAQPSLTESINKQAAIQTRPQEKARPLVTAFPEQPLISSQPLRYNVQLNQQLTLVQQAEHYLQATEKQLLQLSSAITRHAGSASVSQQARQLLTLLEQRQQRSGGTVTRQLQINLEGKSRVSFTLRDGEALLTSSQAEMLTFSLAGNKRNISVAALEAESPPSKSLLRLNQALGKWGIHGQLTADQQVTFDVNEQDWPRVSQHLSVQGSGERYPAGKFFPVKPQAEPSLEDDVAGIVQAPAQAGTILPKLGVALDTLGRQQELIKRSKRSVQARIQSMATFPEGNALAAAVQISSLLSARNFAVMTQAMGAQANIHSATVRNVLALT
ncbi:hypothetical protein ACGVWS_07070 [Enterobacteriaceae bacterium LUAb1]